MTKKRGKYIKRGLSLLLVMVMMITAVPIVQVLVEAADVGSAVVSCIAILLI